MSDETLHIHHVQPFHIFDVLAKPTLPIPAKLEEVKQTPVKSDEHSDDDGDSVGGQGDVQPVGHDYVEEVSGQTPNSMMLSLCVWPTAMF